MKMRSPSSESSQCARGAGKKGGRERRELGLGASGQAMYLEKLHKEFCVCLPSIDHHFTDSSHFPSCNPKAPLTHSVVPQMCNQIYKTGQSNVHEPLQIHPSPYVFIHSRNMYRVPACAWHCSKPWGAQEGSKIDETLAFKELNFPSGHQIIN